MAKEIAVIRDRIKNILKQIKGDYFDAEDHLLTDGYINSFELIEVISAIEKSFNIRIPIGELNPEELDSILGISAIIERYSEK